MTTQNQIAEHPETECEDCGKASEHRTCADCDHEADVIDCGHYSQPVEIAASVYGGDPVCDECEAARARVRAEAMQ